MNVNSNNVYKIDNLILFVGRNQDRYCVTLSMDQF